MRIAVDLHNLGELMESTIASEVLVLADAENINADELNALITSIQNCSTFPVTWAKPLVGVALTIEGVDLKLLADFWSALNQEREDPIWLQLIPLVQSSKHLVAVSGLMKLKDDSAMDLVMQIVSRCPDIPLEISLEMNRRAASELQMTGLSSFRKTTLVRCLLNSRATIEEAKLYGDNQTFDAIRKSTPHSISQITERLVAMPQTLPNDDFPSLRTELKNLLSRKEAFPAEISAAALDALIQLDVISCPPISENDCIRPVNSLKSWHAI